MELFFAYIIDFRMFTIYSKMQIRIKLVFTRNNSHSKNVITWKKKAYIMAKREWSTLKVEFPICQRYCILKVGENKKFIFLFTLLNISHTCSILTLRSNINFHFLNFWLIIRIINLLRYQLTNIAQLFLIHSLIKAN